MRSNPSFNTDALKRAGYFKRQPPHERPREERLVTIGQSSAGQLLVVCHVEQGDTIRIISARRATSHEREDYEA